MIFGWWLCHLDLCPFLSVYPCLFSSLKALVDLELEHIWRYCFISGTSTKIIWSTVTVTGKAPEIQGISLGVKSESWQGSHAVPRTPGWVPTDLTTLYPPARLPLSVNSGVPGTWPWVASWKKWKESSFGNESGLSSVGSYMDLYMHRNPSTCICKVWHFAVCRWHLKVVFKMVSGQT